jgi:hypothetical protein
MNMLSAAECCARDEEAPNKDSSCDNMFAGWTYHTIHKQRHKDMVH